MDEEAPIFSGYADEGEGVETLTMTGFQPQGIRLPPLKPSRHAAFDGFQAMTGFEWHVPYRVDLFFSPLHLRFLSLSTFVNI